MKGFQYLPLFLSVLATATRASVLHIKDNADLEAHLAKAQYAQYHEENISHNDDAYVPEKVRRDIPADVQAALAKVRKAQVEQGKKNRNTFKNPRRPQFKLRPPGSKKKTKNGSQASGSDSVTTDDVSEELTKAAVLIAEYEAPSYNETIPDLGPGFPKLHKRQGGTFWMEGVAHGAVAIGGSSGYKVFRNVKDFGAVGDGRTDDTAAINLAISSGDRCGDNCGSSTVKPALVYFPSGTYLVSKSIIGYYNTQLVGNAASPPIIRAASSFIGLGVFSSNVYIEGANGAQWYINQNNFMRQIRNFIIDMRPVPNVMQGQSIAPAGIHWQVAQATSLQNVQIIMSSRSDTTHLGIFMENGSGGFMSDVSFSGGNIGAYLGNQQFTIRKFSFNGCKVAVNTHWNWALSAKSFLINNCGVGFNVSASAGSGQGTGSITIMDTTIMNTPTGITAVLTGSNRTSLMVDNLKLINVPTAIISKGTTVLSGGTTVIDSWGAGLTYESDVQMSYAGRAQVGGAVLSGVTKPSVLLGDDDGWFERSKPQYSDLPASSFYDVKARGGARGNGRNDDTASINAALQAATSAGLITYFPHGMYLVTDTIFVPSGARIVGEVWSQIQGSGSKFSDISSPRVVIRVGNRGDVGTVEIQDMLFGTRGGTAGAILVEWNIKATGKGTAALWDTHWRVGGSIGSNLQKSQCPKLTGSVNPSCIAASLLLHMTLDSSGYFENAWIWTADHDLDVVTQDQIDIYVGRGVLIESQGPVWMYGTASEHNVLYQYQLQGAKNIFMALIQTESPYFQTSPGAPTPFTYMGSGINSGGSAKRDIVANVTGSDSVAMMFMEKRQDDNGLRFRLDPGFGNCQEDSIVCAVSWAVRILSSVGVQIFGAGLYSWFQNYDQTCLDSSSCQWNVAQVDGQSKEIRFNNLVTVGSSQMVTNPIGFTVNSQKTRNGFASSALAFQSLAASGGSFGDDGNPPDDLAYLGAVGAAGETEVLIVSTDRIPDGGTLEDQKLYWEVYTTGPEVKEINCEFFDDHAPLGRAKTPPRDFIYRSFPGPPDLLKGIKVFGQTCHYISDDPDEDWLYFPDNKKFGKLECNGFESPFSCFKVPMKNPVRAPDTNCANKLWYIEAVICPLAGYHQIAPRLEPKDLLLPAMITLEFMRRWVRTNFYRHDHMLFYTRRLPENHWQYEPNIRRPGLSRRARHLAARANLNTIWEGWPSYWIDGEDARERDFYEIDNPDNFLALIEANPPPQVNGQFQYFSAMSRVYAEQGGGTVYVMTEDPAHIVQEGIWHDTEYAVLTEPGRTWVNRIIAVDPQGGRPHLIFTREPDEAGMRPAPERPVPWRGGLPWGDPIEDLPPDDEGPAPPPGWKPPYWDGRDRPKLRERGPLGENGGVYSSPSSFGSGLMKREGDLEVTFEVFNYGEMCIESNGSWNDHACPSFAEVFSPSHYEKIRGANSYRDFFG